MRMGWAIGLLCLLPNIGEAATVCVILNGSVITAVVPCGETDNPPSTQIDTTDARWTALLLTNAQQIKQAALDAQFNQHFDLATFIRGGTVTTVTAAQIGTFLATITNNYRTLRASIAAAANVAAVTAIDITAGWPANP